MIEKIVRKEVELQEGVKLYSVPDARMSDEELREAIGSWDSIWEEPAAEMCQDIDVEPGIKTLILGGFDEFCFYPEEKVFPDVVEIHIDPGHFIVQQEPSGFSQMEMPVFQQDRADRQR